MNNKSEHNFHEYEDIQKHVRKYITIFITLLALTAVTVFASMHKTSVALAIFIGLVIATMKGSLVAGYFMHLTHEKKIIYFILLLMLIFFAVLLALPVLTSLDVISMS